MDIVHRLHLRSFVKPSITPLAKALGFALVFHSLLFIYWKPIEKITVAEIPDWINIKLIAGFEEKKNTRSSKPVEKVKTKPNEVKRQAKIKSNKKKNISQNNIKPQQKIKEANSPASSATTFIKADSRPYSLENPKPVYPAAARRRGMQGVVLLSVEVNIKGYVDRVNILRSSGFRVLDMAALSSVEKWKFIPAHQEKRTVESIVEVPIRFILDKTK